MRAKRSCLQCNRLFISAGNWNRICSHCKESPLSGWKKETVKEVLMQIIEDSPLDFGKEAYEVQD